MVEVNLCDPVALLYKGSDATAVVWLWRVDFPIPAAVRRHRDGRTLRTTIATPGDWIRLTWYADGYS